MENKLQVDVLDLLERYARMPYEEHGYINPNIISLLFEAMNYGDSTLQSSYELDKWYDNMWGQ